MTQHITITETGLAVAGAPTDDELIETGKELARQEQDLVQQGRNLCWAIGDWYNSIPKHMSKKKACERAGIDGRNARRYAQVCVVIDQRSALTARQDLRQQLGYSRCQAITFAPEESRPALIEEALQNNLSSRQVEARVNEIKGVVPRALGEKISNDMLTELKAVVPKSKHSRLMTIMKKFAGLISKEVEARSQAERARLQALSAKVKKDEERMRKARLRMRTNMTDDEYRLIMQCLHPDRAPQGQEERYKRAFTVFKRVSEQAGVKLVQGAEHEDAA